MKILPLAKIAAAKKRLIEQTKEMNMPKIDVEALWAQAALLSQTPMTEFARLILEEAAKACELTVAASTKRGSAAICAAAVRRLKP